MVIDPDYVHVWIRFKLSNEIQPSVRHYAD